MKSLIRDLHRRPTEAWSCYCCKGCSKHHLRAYHIDPNGIGGLPGCLECLPETLTKLRRCQGCKAAFYCVKDCQRTDWQVHRPACHGAPKFLLDRKRVHAMEQFWAGLPKRVICDFFASAMFYTERPPGVQYALLVYLAVDTFAAPGLPVTADTAQFKFSVCDARCLPLRDVQNVLAWMTEQEPRDYMFDAVRKSTPYYQYALEPRDEGEVPALLVCGGASYPHNIVVRREFVGGGAQYEDWVARLKQAVNDG